MSILNCISRKITNMVRSLLWKLPDKIAVTSAKSTRYSNESASPFGVTDSYRLR